MMDPLLRDAKAAARAARIQANQVWEDSRATLTDTVQALAHAKTCLVRVYELAQDTRNQLDFLHAYYDRP